jgi:hypothetical protein
VNAVEDLTQRVLAVHEVDQRHVDFGDERQLALLTLRERPERVDGRDLDGQLEPSLARKLGGEDDEVGAVTERRKRPIEQEWDGELAGRVLGDVGGVHEGVLEVEHHPRVEVDGHVEVERSLTSLGGMHVDLPGLSEGVGLDEVALVVDVETVLDRVVLEVGDGPGEVDCHGSEATGVGRDRVWQSSREVVMAWDLDWNIFQPVFIDGNWWYDREDNSLIYRLGGDAEAREWGDTAWEFPGPDDYPALAAEIEPGWTAKAGEKAMYEALVNGDAYSMDLAAGQFPEYRSTADTLAGVLSLNSRRSWAGELLDRAIESGYEPRDDPFIRKYLTGAGIVVPIAPGVVVPLPLTRTAVALAAAELHQAAQEYERAIAVLEPVERTTHVVLSLVELLCAAGRYREAVELTEGVVNVDDVAALTLAYRALAQGELGDRDAASATLDAVFGREQRTDDVLAFAGTVRESLDHPAP